MFRLITPLSLLSLLLCSIGCRMCDTPYDYCIPAYIDRPEDFRGCGPMYRAGSVLGSDGDAIRQTAYYEESNLYNNAGNYGVLRALVPGYPASNSGDGISEPRIPFDDTMPSIDDLINRPRGISPGPVVPPVVPRPIPPSGDDSPVPFSPNDRAIPPTGGDLPITLEELQRLDPTVRDLQIISIEDTADLLMR